MRSVVARLLAALLLTGWALPVEASADVVVVPDAAQCGGFTLVQGRQHAACVHPAPDAPDAVAEAQWARRTPAVAPSPCYGDGTTGARVQLIYGYLEGQANRASTVVPMIRTKTVPRMQAVIAAASKGKDLAIRFQQARGCGAVDVPVVRFPRSTVAGKEGGVAEVQFGRMLDHLVSLGFDRSDRKYQVIWDWWNEAGVCGLGEIDREQDTPMPANVHAGLPTLGARTAAGLPPVLLPRYSGVWRLAFGPRGIGCWEQAQSRAGTQIHELMHTLGGVQLSAPHSDGAGHCTDTPSALCAAARRPAVPRCASQPVQVLDCGFDDFWNPLPEPGSYLDNGPNAARSPFFGPQPQDELVASPY